MEIEEKKRHNIWEHKSSLSDVVKFVEENATKEYNPNSKKGEWNWARNAECKYIEISIDMRDGAFVLSNRRRERISLEQLKHQY